MKRDKLLQFERRNPDENGRITEVDFTELLLAYAGYPDKKKARIRKTVKKRYIQRKHYKLKIKIKYFNV